MRKGYHDLLRPEILALIPPTAKYILDLGCGTGNLGKALKQRQDCVVHGIELNKDAAGLAAQNIDKVWIDNLNRFDPAFLPHKYDCIVFADILEHLINPWAVLKKFASVLTDGGTVITSLPNVAHPWIQGNLQRGLFRYEPAGILDITHLRFFTKTSISQLFYAAGLKITGITAHPSNANPYQYHVTAVKPVLLHKKPMTTILILTSDGWVHTQNCIDSIKRKTKSPYKILVIDNGSTDGTVEALRKDHSVFHIENSCNLGFGRGFNVGLMLIDTPYFVLSNNDVIVTNDWLAKMIKHIELDEKLVLLGAMSNQVSGPQRVPNSTHKSERDLEAFAKNRALEISTPLTYFPRIVFFFTLFKATALQQIGFFDEIYEQGNYEDDDYCARVAIKQLKCAFDNTVFIHHWGSAFWKGDNIAYRKSLDENRVKFMNKYHLTTYQGYGLELPR